MVYLAPIFPIFCTFQGGPLPFEMAPKHSTQVYLVSIPKYKKALKCPKKIYVLRTLASGMSCRITGHGFKVNGLTL